ncbi:hypothetical protein N0V91_009642 [Didymella pomorum]|uniref:Vacuolar protein sorting-associated protein 62 n=1 Tax=Didymella pomorum TaxID=749634 RepID=A0A9W9D395_9PLEO|nr:hypothetical protein N0V91_009642 [Didymella pomorum]
MVERKATSDTRIDLGTLNLLNETCKDGEKIYLTSRDDIASDPQWLKGVEDLRAGNAHTGAIIVVEKEQGVVDVFYFVFWAYNYGGEVLGKNLGNHVGDWEHVMIRFKNGTPKKVWLSQHANGEAYTFRALEKNGARPVLYIAKGSHAIYARQGNIDHTIPNFNTDLPFLLVDQCKAGPAYDPLFTSCVYSYDPAARRFEALDASSPAPGWLLFNGHWGDASYPAGDSRQKSLVGFKKFGDGPTGPADKQLDRKRVWPDNSHAWGQMIRTSLDGRTRLRDQIKEWWWRVSAGEGKGMRVLGQPERVYADGTAVPLKEM